MKITYCLFQLNSYAYKSIESSKYIKLKWSYDDKYIYVYSSELNIF